MAASKPLSQRQVGGKYGFRSGLEEQLAAEIKAAGCPVQYESFVIPYTKPAKPSRYTPDWWLPNGVIIESKGRFLSDDRAKHDLIREQHPYLDVRFVFSNANARISKTSKTTYAAWCTKRGILYSHKHIPLQWFQEPVNEASLKAIEELLKLKK